MDREAELPVRSAPAGVGAGGREEKGVQPAQRGVLDSLGEVHGGHGARDVRAALLVLRPTPSEK